MSKIVPLEGFGGGSSSPLNFKIVAYATEEELAAAQPAENTIGVVTTNTITSWIFDAIEPTDPIEGMVWITIGTSSTVAFNAIKKNSIQVYPLSAKQYIGGAWAGKVAKSYQSSKWVTWWNGYLYDNGDQCKTYSGGWTTSDYIFWTYGCSGSLKSGYMSIALVSGQASGGIGTVNKIDLSGHTKLHAIVSPSGGQLYMCVLKNKSDDMHGNSVLARTLVNPGTKVAATVDISNINAGYIGFGTSDSAKIYAVWLE